MTSSYLLGSIGCVSILVLLVIVGGVEVSALIDVFSAAFLFALVYFYAAIHLGFHKAFLLLFPINKASERSHALSSLRILRSSFIFATLIIMSISLIAAFNAQMLKASLPVILLPLVYSVCIYYLVYLPLYNRNA